MERGKGLRDEEYTESGVGSLVASNLDITALEKIGLSLTRGLPSSLGHELRGGHGKWTRRTWEHRRDLGPR